MKKFKRQTTTKNTYKIKYKKNFSVMYFLYTLLDFSRRLKNELRLLENRKFNCLSKYVIKKNIRLIMSKFYADNKTYGMKKQH